ncbi:hypothetical protein [Pedobacter sp. L105]|uniref:hypothetical protein n=1 Tax=Pedobacter sp. L105 TaxID=1641871 RepID=UPI00131B2242|nr:hypothetical protein [Pedobacter sp. L105]
MMITNFISKITLFSGLIFGSFYASGQSKIITTGENPISTTDPYAADIVIGSDLGVRHNSSIMMWSGGSASRLSNAGDIFSFSVWNTTIPNVALGATVGATSYFKGNVGIGTDAAEFPLTVYGVANFYPHMTGGVDIRSLSINYAPINASFINNDYPIVLTTGGGNQPMILDAPRVGIGTTTPDAKLSVNGTIHSKEVKIDLTGWADYVFNPTFQLRPINEVESYIDQNHHLPDMPAEKEVIQNGVNLGDMVKLQTKKIEELTLYLIEQQKQIDRLKKVLENRTVNK